MKFHLRSVAILLLLFILVACTSKSEKAYMEAEAAFSAGQWDSAIQLADQIINKYAKTEEANLAKELKEKALNEIHLEEGSELYNSAYKHYQEGNWEDCLSDLNRLKADYGDVPEIEYVDLVVMNCNAGRDFEKALKSSSEKKYDDAIKIMEKIIHDYPQYENIGDVSGSLNDAKTARGNEVFDLLQSSFDSGIWGAVESYNKLIQELVPGTELSDKAEQIAAEAKDLKKESLFNELKTIYGDQNWKEVIESANKIISEFPSSEEAQTAAKYKQTAEAKLIELAKQEARKIIRFKRVYYHMNSAGGAEVHFSWVNNSDKQIKYITFGISFYNGVGDLIKPDYDREAINYCSDTGPFSKGKGTGSNWYWGPFYSWDIKSVKLVSVRIEYMDGSTRNLTKDEVEYVQY